MNLSPHFTLEEMVASQTATRSGIDNTPPPEVVARLRHTALGLEAVRVRLGAPVIVSSGYRCPALNRAVGGSRFSDHMTGDAVDFICPGFGPSGTVVGVLMDAGIAFDQLIDEYGRWVHLSFGPRMRGEVLIRDAQGYRPFLGEH